MSQRKTLILFLPVMTVIFLASMISFSSARPLRMQTIYVPVYSLIFHGDRENIFNLTATVSIRNTDMKKNLTVDCVDYYDSNGKLLKSFLKGGRTLRPLESIHYIIHESDIAGGPGANFIVKWHVTNAIATPLIESIMIGTRNQQGISFISRGVVIDEK